MLPNVMPVPSRILIMLALAGLQDKKSHMRRDYNLARARRAPRTYPYSEDRYHYKKRFVDYRYPFTDQHELPGTELRDTLNCGGGT